jgi:hypothetical protein
MIAKHSPEFPGAIQDQLNYLKEKKAVLDELITCLERYSEYRIPQRGPKPALNRPENTRRLAGAA